MSRDFNNPHPKPLSMGLVVAFYLFLVALAALGRLTDLKDAVLHNQEVARQRMP